MRIAKDTNLNANGIYLIQNLLNGKVYVGKTEDSFYSRYHNHRSDLQDNHHINIHLQRAVNKYGIEHFEFCILEENPADINESEIYWIGYLKYIGAELYNIKGGGEGGKHSQETKDKISKRQKAAWGNQEYYNTHVARLLDAESTKKRVEASVRKRVKVVCGLISPDGTVYKNIHNLTEFCKEHNLNQGNAYSVVTGKRKSHKGWRRVEEN